MSFTHRDHGTPERSWVDALAEHSVSWEHLTEDFLTPGGLVVVAAHPDDETLGAGGLVALATRIGCTVRVVVATSGEASNPLSPTRQPQQLALIREAETSAAMAMLAENTRPDFCRIPDGRLCDIDHLGVFTDYLDAILGQHDQRQGDDSLQRLDLS